MGLRNDCAALESIPLRLMIVAIVAALSVLPAAQTLEELKTREYVRRASMQLDQIISVCEIVLIEGPGSVRTLDLDFRGEGAATFRCLCIGDADGGRNSSSAVLHLSNGAVIVRSATDPPACIRSSQQDSLTVTAPEGRLRMSCELSSASWFVQVELL